MTVEAGNAKALQAIGAYLCAYSDATYELGETLKVMFRIQDNAMADAIVASLGDFARQAGLALALCQDARNADGTELSKERKEQINETVKKCFACNDDRVKLAHGRLEPRTDGSVAIIHIKIAGGAVKGKEPIIWSATDWTEKTKMLTKLADELRNFQKELRTITIVVPTGSMLGWLTRDDSYANVIHRQRMTAAFSNAVVEPVLVPRPPPDETNK